MKQKEMVSNIIIIFNIFIARRDSVFSYHDEHKKLNDNEDANIIKSLMIQTKYTCNKFFSVIFCFFFETTSFSYLRLQVEHNIIIILYFHV